MPITPIDDLNKKNSEKSQEDFLRCQLASVYRLVDLKGWSWSVYNHITVKFPRNFEQVPVKKRIFILLPYPNNKSA